MNEPHRLVARHCKSDRLLVKLAPSKRCLIVWKPPISILPNLQGCDWLTVGYHVHTARRQAGAKHRVLTAGVAATQQQECIRLIPWTVRDNPASELSGYEVPSKSSCHKHYILKYLTQMTACASASVNFSILLRAMEAGSAKPTSEWSVNTTCNETRQQPCGF